MKVLLSFLPRPVLAMPLPNNLRRLEDRSSFVRAGRTGHRGLPGCVATGASDAEVKQAMRGSELLTARAELPVPASRAKVFIDNRGFWTPQLKRNPGFCGHE